MIEYYTEIEPILSEPSSRIFGPNTQQKKGLPTIPSATTTTSAATTPAPKIKTTIDEETQNATNTLPPNSPISYTPQNSSENLMQNLTFSNPNGTFTATTNSSGGNLYPSVNGNTPILNAKTTQTKFKRALPTVPQQQQQNSPASTTTGAAPVASAKTQNRHFHVSGSLDFDNNSNESSNDNANSNNNANYNNRNSVYDFKNLEFDTTKFNDFENVSKSEFINFNSQTNNTNGNNNNLVNNNNDNSHNESKSNDVLSSNMTEFGGGIGYYDEKNRYHWRDQGGQWYIYDEKKSEYIPEEGPKIREVSNTNTAITNPNVAVQQQQKEIVNVITTIQKEEKAVKENNDNKESENEKLGNHNDVGVMEDNNNKNNAVAEKGNEINEIKTDNEKGKPIDSEEKQIPTNDEDEQQSAAHKQQKPEQNPIEEHIQKQELLNLEENKQPEEKQDLFGSEEKYTKPKDSTPKEEKPDES